LYAAFEGGAGADREAGELPEAGAVIDIKRTA
jgi:hypothetical protein